MLGGTSVSLVQTISLGQVVKSITGRDAETIYLVVGINGRNVFLSDGRERSIIKPKKKNIRHVKVYERISEALADKFIGNRKVTDEDIRQAIANLQPR